MENEDFIELELEDAVTEDDQPTEPENQKAKPDRGTYLETSNVVRIREKPGGRKFERRIPTGCIKDVKRNEFLVLGFDTEYQSPENPFNNEEIKEGKAKYEVVSYQFHAINSNGREWNGIAIPDNEERISFTDFIVFAIARGALLKETIPKTIILVAHYNRADLPAFDDRKQLLWRLQNVRSSLISTNAPVRVKVRFDDDEANDIEVSVYVRDTMLLAPAGRKSLAELGRLIDREKLRLSKDDDEELEMKRNMKELRSSDWELFREYALIDAEISAKYFLRLTEMYQTVTGETFVPSALSNIGMKLLIKEWDERQEKIDRVEVVGKERIQEAVWDERTQQFRNLKRTPYVEELSWFVDFVTECYHGGRNEQLWFGPSYKADWYDYDLTSAYPTTMATIGRIDWRKVRPVASLDELVAEDFAFVCVDFQFPESTRYPTLPVRSQNGIIFPLTGRSYCAMPEIQLARQLNCEMKLKYGVVVPHDQNEQVFFPFIKDSIQRRAEAPTKIENAFWKELTNSCYGKTAQGLREKRVFSLRKKRGERIGESAISNPLYAAYITSFVRAVVGEIMNRIPDDKMVFSVTTDGFITDATADEMEVAKSGPLAKKFSEARAALTGDPEVLSEKHRVRQLLGWRTRGQATLKPGENVESERFVLAKAGIKAPVQYTEVVEQNEFITEMFFRRSAEVKIELDYHTSVREMIFWNADLVSKKARKHISMEYDFKRKPRAIGVTEVDNIKPLSTGPKPHIIFSTEPWKSAADFKSVRSVWNDFYRKTGICLKDPNDYAEFADYFDMVSSLTPGKQAYLSRENGDLKRFKRDLCRAFQRGLAGFGAYQHITAKEFAHTLNNAGFREAGVIIPVSDVNNAAKPNAPFKRRETPPTRAVRKIMAALKETFPSIVESEFLAEPGFGAIKLTGALSNPCEFVARAQPVVRPGPE
jgi:hypothetical protein